MSVDRSIDALGPGVEVRRSARRRKTVQARREGDRIVVMVPAGMSRAEEQHWVQYLVDRILANEKRRATSPSDDELHRHARELAARYLEPSVNQPIEPASVAWVSNQNHRWGSCTPTQGRIRVSDRLRVMPQWVIDYVLIHELAHLVEPNHTARFHALVATYPDASRAAGFLAGWEAAIKHAQDDASPP